MGCPDEACKKSHDELREFVYGEEPGKGLQGWITRVENCVKQKVPKAWVGRLIVSFAVTALLGIGIFYGGVRMNHYACARNSKDLDKHEQKIEKLEKLSQEANVRQVGVKKDLEQIRRDLKRITRLLEEGSGP